MRQMTAAAKVALVGCGAQAKYALEILATTGRQVSAVYDPVGKMAGGRLEGREIKPFGPDGAGLLRGDGAGEFLVCLADNRRKERLFNACLAAGLEPASLVHPTAVAASSARLGRGVIVNPLAVIQPHAVVGDGCMVHAGVIVEHDNTIDAFANLGPGAKLAGWVRVGRGSTVFTGAVIAPGVSLGRDVVVGAGSVVLKDVPPGRTVAGVPAREIGP